MDDGHTFPPDTLTQEDATLTVRPPVLRLRYHLRVIWLEYVQARRLAPFGLLLGLGDALILPLAFSWGYRMPQYPRWVSLVARGRADTRARFHLG